jgi:hypothetical protein
MVAIWVLIGFIVVLVIVRRLSPSRSRGDGADSKWYYADNGGQPGPDGGHPGSHHGGHDHGGHHGAFGGGHDHGGFSGGHDHGGDFGGGGHH